MPKEELVSERSYMCRICLSLDDTLDNIIAPCGCKGTMKYVHKRCLKIWRYKSKKIEEIKRCEQCLQIYNLEDEILPHFLLVKITSVLLLTILFIFVHFMINLLFETVAVVSIDMANYELNEYRFNNPNYNNYYLQDPVFVPRTNIPSVKIGITGTTIVIALIYQIFEKRNLIYVLNYIFTLWRVVKFGYILDKALLWTLNAHQFYYLIRNLNKFTDNVLVFILNYS
ncbi:hypothetical protein TUBRATIS_13020 [Tubulinosema ratisbonensis]|uniref:RING-CH-type domain-containing protein n=1 Tax=Tubulinosema ratisbonensis TaxID=291195 RepID=A0A437ALX0_9MICR|nr:hypothetical protein TUBRATIS_13020 [Tubulinosema ratisbonensis]